jgi:membrane-anchored protein YejM (alkaline phosphatase superfamily)
MNTKILMISSAIVMGMAGICFTFLPEEIINYAGYTSTVLNILFLQILGALYLAFATLNWMAKANLIGGIYSKPVAIGNFAHFFIAGVSIIKSALSAEASVALWIGAIVYTIYAIIFGVVAFGNPIKKDS